MTNEELTLRFKLACRYAEKAYYEIFNREPDTQNSTTQQILDMLVHAWLSGYNYLKSDSHLDNTLFQVFGYHGKIKQ